MKPFQLSVVSPSSLLPPVLPWPIKALIFSYFLWAAGTCVVLGGEASRGAFPSTGSAAPLLPAETKHLWAAGQEQPAEHGDERTAAQDTGAAAGQDHQPKVLVYTVNLCEVRGSAGSASVVPTSSCTNYLIDVAMKLL